MGIGLDLRVLKFSAFRMARQTATKRAITRCIEFLGVGPDLNRFEIVRRMERRLARLKSILRGFNDLARHKTKKSPWHWRTMGIDKTRPSPAANMPRLSGNAKRGKQCPFSA